MIKKYFAALLLMMSMMASADAQSVDSMVTVQQELKERLVQLSTADPADKLFFEDVLRRKNDKVRADIELQLQENPRAKGLDGVVRSEMVLMGELLQLSHQDLVELTKAVRKAKGDEKDDLEFAAQKRLGIMDMYYEEAFKTLSWGETLNIDFIKEKTAILKELTNRADLLANIIHYLESQKSDIAKRMQYASVEKKDLLAQDATNLSERVSLMVASLEVTTALMEQNNIDITEYKQLIFSVTGDINSDVLDIGVAYGLTEEWVTHFKDWAVENTPSIIVKLVIFSLILWVTSFLSRLAKTAIKKSVSHSKMKFSKLMQEFFVSMGSKFIMMIGILIALSQIGINLGPLLTGFGVAGVVIGFALKDTLSNFASGMMILIYRPFDVGDLVDLGGIVGKVNRMNLVSTTIKTVDNQNLIFPNNKIWGDVIKNVTIETERRVDMVFGIGYQDDIEKAKVIFTDILESHPLVLKTPEPMVRLHTLNESSVDFIVRPWVKTDDYWNVYWEVTETVKKRLDAEGVSIPFPQRDVHVYKHEA
ncbi:mechanosensitive ion channel family protein [Aliivibrio finisterrensis]|uniref:Small-conductance mechanosensitive channel n=1 Tax=Aliivibrio finisterrensis TaxID=511998 RepID=A0A6N6RXB4_9GAMM|nr:mechanosensitive ion channel family protein [Aliivibrio finisterrensis]KAB2826081.1 mechanosensitive ion channel family protein [Aliivibrio finisterrensis]